MHRILCKYFDRYINPNPLKLGLTSLFEESTSQPIIASHVNLSDNDLYENAIPKMEMTLPSLEYLELPSTYDLQSIPNYFDQLKNPTFGYHITNQFLDKEINSNEEGIFRRKPSNMKDFVLYCYIYIIIYIGKR